MCGSVIFSLLLARLGVRLCSQTFLPSHASNLLAALNTSAKRELVCAWIAALYRCKRSSPCSYVRVAFAGHSDYPTQNPLALISAANTSCDANQEHQQRTRLPLAVSVQNSSQVPRWLKFKMLCRRQCPGFLSRLHSAGGTCPPRTWLLSQQDSHSD